MENREIVETVYALTARRSIPAETGVPMVQLRCVVVSCPLSFYGWSLIDGPGSGYDANAGGRLRRIIHELIAEETE
jgi:hypothetical protein